MEDPAREIVDVVRGLVEKPTLKRQAAVLQKYFTRDVQFYHFYINTNGGLKDLTAIYQMAELIVNYQGVEFQKIIYDEGANSMALRMSVVTRPWGILPLTTLKFFTMLELQDCKIEGGKTVKKIKVQRDFFERSPILLMIPIFGQIYDSDTIRTLIGTAQATTFELIRSAFYFFLPAHLWHGILGLWCTEIADTHAKGDITA
jgi:hypothetical protein